MLSEFYLLMLKVKLAQWKDNVFKLQGFAIEVIALSRKKRLRVFAQ